MKIKLIRAKTDDAERIWRMQIESFSELLDKYHDYDTSPGNEPLERTIERLNSLSTFYYIIEVDKEAVGAIRVIDYQEPAKSKRISPLFVLPKYRNKGIAQEAIKLVEKIHGQTIWELETILQEQGNCHLYEKMGYSLIGRPRIINDKMTLVLYQK